MSTASGLPLKPAHSSSPDFHPQAQGSALHLPLGLTRKARFRPGTANRESSDRDFGTVSNSDPNPVDGFGRQDDAHLLDTAKMGSPFFRLSDELLLMILASLEGPETLLSVDDRAYLSVESFQVFHKMPSDAIEAIGNFRLACRRFSRVGAERQFARVTTRFSRAGFKRLDMIASHPHLARSVRKFSYMVPWFYSRGKARVKEALDSVPGCTLSAESYQLRIREQHQIVDTREDLRVLKRAFAAFTELQHLRFLPVQDRQDDRLLDLIRQREDLMRLVEIKWTTAFSHGSRTMTEAVMSSKSKVSIFSSPMISPQSAIMLAEHPLGFNPEFLATLETLAGRLTCLQLHFDGDIDLEAKMVSLAPFLRTAFHAAKNMQHVHVGFPSHRPVALRLEDVFHDVRWEKLVAFGIQGWKLDADDLIAFVSRYKERLKGLRLRDVLLNEGSTWQEILPYLRNNLLRLNWVSLRRIGYAKTFDEHWVIGGVEVPDDPPGGDSDSESDSNSDGDLNDAQSDLAGGQVSETESIGSESSGEENSDDERGPTSHEMEFPHIVSQAPVTRLLCTCDNTQSLTIGTEELGDNGVDVSNGTRRLWEKWVVRRCPEHGPR